MKQIVNATIKCLLSFLLPQECAGCGCVHESGFKFCHECTEELKCIQTAPRCRFCSLPITLADAPCAHCRGNGLPPFDQIICLGVLDGPLKSAIHRAKYTNRWPIANCLADHLIAREDLKQMLQTANVLVPVPLHKTKQRQRGFNQADIIARRIGSRAHNTVQLPVVLAARRILPTQTQTHLHSRAKRTENLRNAFVLKDAALIEDKHVVLVDDVMTTGATLLSLARTLKPAKPASLSAIVLAVADPKGRAFEII